MGIDRRTVDHVARLARLALSDEERDRFTRQLAALLDHFAALQRLDTEDVEPASDAVEQTGAMRDDVARPGLDWKVALDAAPDQADGFFKVPPVIEMEADS